MYMKDVRIKDLQKADIGKKVVIKGIIKTVDKTSNNGGKYLSISINDGSGEIWDNIFKDKNQELYETLTSLDNSGKYRVVGNVRSVKEGTSGFNGLNIEKIELIEGSIKEPISTDSIKEQLKNIFKQINNAEYRKLISAVYKEIDLDLLYKIPVSENHYVYEGGLASHIIRTNEIINSIIGSYKGNLNFNSDLLITAVLIFRVGKTKTLNWNNGKAELTESGVLFEDSSITHDIVSRCLQKSKISEEEKMCLLHMIDASKYKPEYGALAEPKTKEAFLLYYAEMLSLNEAKFARLKEQNISEDNNIIYAPSHKVYYMTENINPKEKED